ncbi:NADH dehydrogenase [ubiquinone] iron-sulfur protein 1, mitochondrial [Tanacetum coccineum]|uniref:NADH dehydrogenase [ubiquinone] iron-sulfur protein 1, mitochondrial n=1 Tax=Tanacetum coccineum TaxID=301880 RepID=A0ABQ5AWM7_9ASTR
MKIHDCKFVVAKKSKNSKFKPLEDDKCKFRGKSDMKKNVCVAYESLTASQDEFTKIKNVTEKDNLVAKIGGEKLLETKEDELLFQSALVMVLMDMKGRWPKINEMLPSYVDDVDEEEDDGKKNVVMKKKIGRKLMATWGEADPGSLAVSQMKIHDHKFVVAKKSKNSKYEPLEDDKCKSRGKSDTKKCVCVAYESRRATQDEFMKIENVTEKDNLVAEIGDEKLVESEKRLNDQMIRGADGRFQPMSWRDSLAVVAKIIRQVKPKEIVGVAVMSTFQPRLEADMVNAIIRKTVRASQAKVGYIGASTDFNYNHEHLGTGPTKTYYHLINVDEKEDDGEKNVVVKKKIGMKLMASWGGEPRTSQKNEKSKKGTP